MRTLLTGGTIVSMDLAVGDLPRRSIFCYAGGPPAGADAIEQLAASKAGR